MGARGLTLMGVPVMGGGASVLPFVEHLSTDPDLRVLYPLDDADGTVRAINPAQDGRNIIVNGSFADDSHWTLSTNVSVSGGKLVFAAATGSTYQVVPMLFGVDYELTLTITNYASGTLWALVGNSAVIEVPSANGTYVIDKVSAGAVARLTLLVPRGTYTAEISNVQLRRKNIAANSLSAANSGAIQNQPLVNGAIGCGYDGVDDYTNLYSVPLNDVFDPRYGSLVMLVEAANATVWTSGTRRTIAHLRGTTQVGDLYDGLLVEADGKGGILCTLAFGGVVKVVRAAVETYKTLLLHICVDNISDTFRMFINGVQAGSARTGLGTYSSQPEVTAQILGRLYTVSGTSWHGYLSAFGVLGEPRSDAAAATDAVEAAVSGQAAGPLASDDAVFVACAGDSLTLGTGATIGYPERLVGLIDDVEIYNDGVGSLTTAQILARRATRVDPKAESGRTHQFAVLLGGTNDISIGVDLATIQSNITDEVSGLKAVGYEVLVGTVMKVSTWSGATETKRQDLNAWIAAQASVQGFTVVDFAADSRLDNPNDPITGAGDGVHKSNAGYAVMAELVAAIINAAI